jgi:hypothetical protein
MNLQTIKLIGGAMVTVDLDSRAKCRSCGALIKFGATRNNKLIPIIEVKPGEYQAHFVDCPGADNWRGNTRESMSNRIREEEQNQEMLNKL